MTSYLCNTCHMGIGRKLEGAKDHLRANPTHVVLGRRIVVERVML